MQYKGKYKDNDLRESFQARKANSGTIRMKRSLLVKAGQALAPDAFSLVLDSENDTKGQLHQIELLTHKHFNH